jgi:hypothetical protein
VHSLKGLNWRKAILTIGAPLLASIGTNLQGEASARLIIASLLIVISAGLINWLTDPRK